MFGMSFFLFWVIVWYVFVEVKITPEYWVGPGKMWVHFFCPSLRYLFLEPAAWYKGGLGTYSKVCMQGQVEPKLYHTCHIAILNTSV